MSAVVVLARSINASDVENIIASWKLSTAEANQLRWVKDLVDVNGFGIDDKELQTMVVNGTPREWVMDYLRTADRWDDLEDFRNWKAPVFPVTGNDLLVAGMKPGKQLGDTLKAMKGYWVARNYTPGKNFFLETLDMFVDGDADD